MVRCAGTFDFGWYFSQSQSNLSSGTMTRDSSGSMVANGKFWMSGQCCVKRGTGGMRRTAGLPRWHLVIAWKSVDFPTFARPT